MTNSPQIPQDHARSRRDFLVTAGAMAALAAAARLNAVQPADPSDPRAAAPVGKQPTGPLERRKFGKTDMEVTVLGFGGAEIGYRKTDQEIIDRLLNSALDAGLNVIDTAECYAGSEESIGRAVSGRRKEFYLFTKVGHMEPGEAGWSADSIGRSIDRSLERLKTDYVDVVHLHSCALETLQKGECIEALERARRAGKTRYIGYSGDSKAALYAVESGRFDSLQTSCSYADQEAIDLTLPKAQERNMGVIAKRPIANAVWRHDQQPAEGYVVEYWKRSNQLGYDFTKGEARRDPGPNGAAGMALRFTLAAPGVHVAIVGTSNPERWKQNAEMLREGGPLLPERYEKIRARWKEAASQDWHGLT